MSTKEWFSSWFDSEDYHILYKNRNDEEAKKFIINLVNYLQLSKASKILDLGCGKGRHSITLNEQGYDVTGADLSPASIEFANQFANDHLKFIVHDMRDLIPNVRFDCIVNLFTSFGYFDNIDDNLLVLQNANRMLNDKGILVIDFLNAEKIKRELVPLEEKKIQGKSFKISRFIEDDFVVKEIHIDDAGTEKFYQERVQLFDLQQFEQMLNTCGFSIMTTFGNFNLNEFDPDKSDRLILIAQKR